MQLLLQDFIRRYGTSLDVMYLFGALCGLKKVLELASIGILTLRTYVFRPGSVGHLNFPDHFGEWAGEWSSAPVHAVVSRTGWGCSTCRWCAQHHIRHPRCIRMPPVAFARVPSKLERVSQR